jgi:hypothetical protein
MLDALKGCQDPLSRLSSYFIDFIRPERSLMDDDPMDYVQEFSGKIHYADECDIDREEDEVDKLVEGSEDGVVGTVKGFKVDIWGALDRRIHSLDVCDSHSEELMECYEELFDGHHLREDLNLESVGNLLVVERLEIDPKHRGFGLGLLSLLKTIKEFRGGCCMVAIKPFPLQYCGEGAKDKDRDFVPARKKLINYWCRLGFRRVPRSEYFYFDLAYTLPAPEDLLGRKR